jgi:OFA family oxalate/formate antiporter-like MFS transporter
MSIRLFHPKVPFNPARTPFFYGWVIWLLSTLGFLMSVPGQTMGMAVFTDPFIKAFGLTRTELSLAYLFGTVSSSFFLTTAGRWFDRFGGRLMVTASSIALGAMVVFISVTDQLAYLLGTGFAPFALIFIGYFGVRFFGQGVLTSCSRNVLMPWFVRRRGLVAGVRGVFVSIGFSLAPLLLAWLIVVFGWREALWVLAAIVGLIFPVLTYLFLRDSPASVGLVADGDDSDAAATPQEAPSKTLQEARRSPVLWLYTSSLAIHALFGTALTFHVVSIFSEAGRDASEAFGYFLPAAVFSTTVNLLASSIVDRYPLKPFLLFMLMAFTLGAVGLLNLERTWGYWMLAAGFGAGGGLWGVISNLAFIRFFGPNHLGEVSGFNTSVTVFASAIGPAAFSLALDIFGAYHAAVYACIVVLIILLVAALWLDQAEPATLARRA